LETWAFLLSFSLGQKNVTKTKGKTMFKFLTSFFDRYNSTDQKEKEDVRPGLNQLFEEIRSIKHRKEADILAKQKSAPTEDELIEKNTQEIIEYIGKNLEDQFYKFKKDTALCVVYDGDEIDIHHTLTFDDIFFNRVKTELEIMFGEELFIQFKCEKTFKHYCEFMERELYTLTINVYAIVYDVDNQPEDYPDNFILEDGYDIRGKCYHDIIEHIQNSTKQKEN
jgi:hypothetical protein